MSNPTKPTSKMDTSVLLVPKQPQIILTAAPSAPLCDRALKLLSEQCTKIISSAETHSVTFAPRPTCGDGPGPSKNDFYSQAPHWWQKEDGTWEHRDGQRNPAADSIGCQKQLERMAIAVNTLSLGYEHLSDPSSREACLSKVDELLKTFFVDEETRMVPEVEYSQVIPGQEPLRGNAHFVMATRYLILVAQALTRLPPSHSTRKTVESWFEQHISWMVSSTQGQGACRLDKKISRWYHAALASYLSISDVAKAADHANTILQELMSAHPRPSAELFAPSAPYSLGARPRHSTAFGLEPLFILASLTVPSHAAADSLVGNGTAALRTPAEDVLDWLESVVEFASNTPVGQLEALTDSDDRQAAKLSFFRRQLARWRAGEVEDVDLEGKEWEEGWKDWSKLAWAMI